MIRFGFYDSNDSFFHVGCFYAPFAALHKLVSGPFDVNVTSHLHYKKLSWKTHHVSFHTLPTHHIAGLWICNICGDRQGRGSCKANHYHVNPERVNLKMEDKFAQHSETEVKGYWISLDGFWIACPCLFSFLPGSFFFNRIPLNGNRKRVLFPPFTFCSIKLIVFLVFYRFAIYNLLLCTW